MKRVSEKRRDKRGREETREEEKRGNREETKS